MIHKNVSRNNSELEQSNIALLKLFVKEIWNDQRIENIQNFLSPDIVIHHEHEQFKGIDTWKSEFYGTLIKSIMNIRMEVEDIIAKDEHIVARWNIKGIFNAELNGVLPSGEMIEINGMTWVRIVNNKVVETWTNMNMTYLLKQLQSEVNKLRGILPLCSFCKKIRDEKDYWEQVDVYIQKYSEADISHSICPECMKKHYPEQYASIETRKNRKQSNK